ncbi:MAG: hypothetical protein K6G47_03840 [Clostridia bacterium]|nr:hypothetical protein [Clostridia bacterium]
MISLIKANMKRMFKHMIFIPGLILAMLITFLFLKLRPTEFETMKYWFRTLGLGIPAFFSFFIPLFIGVEYRSGSFRNKVIAGHKQSEIITSFFASSFIGVTMMALCWIAAGTVFLLSAGFAPDKEFIVTSIGLWFAFLAYSSIITLVSLKVRNMIVSTIVCIIFFMVSYFLGVTAFSINMLVESTIGTALLENIFPLGQWFGIMNADDSFVMPVRIIISVGLIAVAVLIANYKINRRELN